MAEEKQETKESKDIKESKDFRHIVRIANTDLDGSKQIGSAITRIKGIGFSFANTLCSLAGIDKEKKAGELTDDELKRVNEAIKTASSKVPSWLLNRRKDKETGKDSHLIISDLDFTKEQDIRLMKKIKSYRGVRHAAGLPVRGQRTRSNFRKNKGKISLGVIRKGIDKRALQAGRDKVKK